MPPDGSLIYAGRKRPADTPDDAARKFVVWARAVGVTGAHSARTICALYWECAEADHRRPVSDARLLAELEVTPGIRVGPSEVDRRKRVWTIEPADAQLALPLAASEPEEAAAEPARRRSRPVARFQSEREFESQQLLQANAHFARRQGRARKQRGSRDMRWAAA